MPIIGIPVRYDYDKNGNIIWDIYEDVRKTILLSGANIYLILPIQDYYDIDPNNNYKELTKEEKIKINNILDKCDGLFLPGGDEFTSFDMYILDYAIKKDIPTLGVCLSMQMMSCYKTDYNLDKVKSNIKHYQKNNINAHSVKIDKDSKLYNILKQDIISVNSLHNYKAKENNIYKTIAKSPDGIIEAIEHPTCTFNIGLQWHPEKIYDKDNNSKLIIDYFIKEAERYKEKKHN